MAALLIFPSVPLPHVLIVIGVGQHRPYKDGLARIIDQGYQPVVVAPDIEDCESSDGFRRWVNLLDIQKFRPSRSLCDSVPCVERFLGIWMSIGKLTQSLPADHVHTVMFSL